jgi:hypothetical protein
MIRSGLTGLHNFLAFQGMLQEEIEAPLSDPVICKSSYWIYTDTGGILRVDPKITERVVKGQRIASMHDIFGKLVKIYEAPEDGIVIGKSVNPVAQTGSRILHLGIIKE